MYIRVCIRECMREYALQKCLSVPCCTGITVVSHETCASNHVSRSTYSVSKRPLDPCGLHDHCISTFQAHACIGMCPLLLLSDFRKSFRKAYLHFLKPVLKKCFMHCQVPQFYCILQVGVQTSSCRSITIRKFDVLNLLALRFQIVYQLFALSTFATSVQALYHNQCATWCRKGFL